MLGKEALRKSTMLLCVFDQEQDDLKIKEQRSVGGSVGLQIQSEENSQVYHVIGLVLQGRLVPW